MPKNNRTQIVALKLKLDTSKFILSIVKSIVQLHFRPLILKVKKYNPTKKIVVPISQISSFLFKIRFIF
jgi:hypothetical protein